MGAVRLASWAGVACASLAAATPALAQEGQPTTWSVPSGESRLVEVGPFERFVVLDPDRIQVERASKGVLKVTGLQRTGLGIVYLFGDAGVRSLAFDVLLPQHVQDAREDAEAPRRPWEEVWLTTGVSAGGTADQWSGGLDQHFSYIQEHEDTWFSGQVAWSLRSDLQWGIPLVRLQGRHRYVEAGIGDTVLTPSELPTPLVRGAWAEVSRPSGLGPSVGLVGGFYRTGTACCALVDPSLGSLVAARGGYRWPEARVVAVAGATFDPDGGTARPLAQLGTRFRRGSLSGAAEVAWAGEGLAAASRLFVIAPRYRTYATARYRQRGYVVTPASEPLFDHLDAALGGAWRVARPLELSLDLSWSSSWRPGAPVVHVASPRATVAISPRGPHLVTLGYGRQDGFVAEGGPWQATDVHQFLTAVHSAHFPRGGRSGTQVHLDLGGDFAFDALRLAHESRIVTPSRWAWGVSAYGQLRHGAQMPAGRLLLGAGREGETLAFFLQAGATTGGAGGGTGPRPIAWGEVEWTPARGHALGAWASVAALGGGAANWSATLRYTVSRLGEVEPRSPLSLRGDLVGTIFLDRNEDGVQGPDEPGVAGVAVRLEGGRWALSDGDGRFAFRAVAAGTHTVTVTAEPRSVPHGNRRRVEVAPLARTQADFALRSEGAISVRVFLDRNEDGRFTPGDLPAPVPAVSLRDALHAPLRDLALEEGQARAEHLEAGRYAVVLDPADLPPGWLPSGAHRVEVDLAEGERVDVDLALRALRSIGGTVRSASGEVAPEVPVTLSNGQRAVTDAQGRFFFREVPEGDVEVLVPGAPPLAVTLKPEPQDVRGLEIRLSQVAAPEEEGIDDPGPLAVVPAALVLDGGEERVLTLRAGAVVAGDGVSWRSANPDVASVEGGVVVARGEGVTEVVARLGDREASPVLVEVHDVPVAGLEPSPARADLGVGVRVPVRVTATYVDGRVADRTTIARWVSSDPEVASVDGDGVVTTHATGRAEIHAELGGMRSEAVPVRVFADVVHLVAAAGIDTLPVGGVLPLTARARLADGSDVEITGAARWTSSRPDALEVTSTGMAKAAAAASGIEVRARWMGAVSEPVHLRVVEGPLSDPRISPTGPVRLGVGERATLRASGSLSSGAQVTLTPLVRWSVDDPEVASVAPDGTLTARSRGRTTVRASWPGGGPTLELRVIVRP